MTSCSKPPQSTTTTTKRIILKKKAPKSPELGIPSSTVKRRKFKSIKKKHTVKEIQDIKLNKPTMEEPILSRRVHHIDDRLPPSTSTVKKDEGFQWESTQPAFNSSHPPKTSIENQKKALIPSRTLKSLHIKPSTYFNDECEELEEYYKLLDENW